MDNRIKADLEKSYNLICNQVAPVGGGWLNLKWRILTGGGEFLVKQYSMERYSKEQVERIEAALQRQAILEKSGVKCPQLRQHEGRVIRWLGDDIAYMVMAFCPGQTQKAETTTLLQMRSLGSVCAVMHYEFSRLPTQWEESLPVFGGYTKEQLLQWFEKQAAKCGPGANTEYRAALLAIEPILARLAPDFFERFGKGLTHEDFQAGNILFDASGVSAILDFDRNCYAYPRHDVGRAILSFALEGDIMNTNKVQAFAEGYSQHLPLTLPDIADALRLTWCIEMQWWIKPMFFEDSGERGEIPLRFRDEVLWLTKHWGELDLILR